MTLFIKDGTGAGYNAKVFSNNKLAVQSVSQGRAAYFADVEEASYLIATGGFISITTANTETGVFYMKYTGDGDFHITSIRTCGVETNKWLLYKDASTGTLISNAVSGVITNTSIASSNLAPITCYKGAEGDTVTNGTVIENWINGMGHSTEDFDGVLVLKKNDSLALTCEVPMASDVCVRILGFEDTGAVT